MTTKTDDKGTALQRKLNVVAPIAPDTTDLVEFLEDLLRRAKEGELSCVAVAATTRENQVVTGWSKSGFTPPFTVVGGIELLKRDFMNKEIE